MNVAIADMLRRYTLQNSDDYENALREIVQELSLCGLWRAKFFEHAVFYGGTALRILHGLDRYSEDLDFSLRLSQPDFSLAAYGNALVEELRSWGFAVDLQVKNKSRQTAIQSAFLKTDTTTALLHIGAPASWASAGSAQRSLKIKIEVDTHPPLEFSEESKLVLQPIPFSVRTMTLPSLFAGKMHAVLCRGWGARVKGRDWYDLVWYVARSVPLDLRHLEQRMRQSGDWTHTQALTAPDLAFMLRERIDNLDVASALADVRHFVHRADSLQLWSQDFFRQIAERVTFTAQRQHLG